MKMHLRTMVFAISIALFFAVSLFALWVLGSMYLDRQAKAYASISYRVAMLERSNARAMAALCQEANLRSRQVQRLSFDECIRYFDTTLKDMYLEPTPTNTEREVSRPGLDILKTPSPTPCDPHVSLCTRSITR